MAHAQQAFSTMHPQNHTHKTLSHGSDFTTLPARGGDAVFQLSRSWWLTAEKKGLITLKRLRLPGNIRGRVLIPIPQARVMIDRLAAEGAQ